MTTEVFHLTEWSGCWHWFGHGEQSDHCRSRDEARADLLRHFEARGLELVNEEQNIVWGARIADR